jgi:hypothetical protein
VVGKDGWFSSEPVKLGWSDTLPPWLPWVPLVTLFVIWAVLSGGWRFTIMWAVLTTLSAVLAARRIHHWVVKPPGQK